jgi:hypothetical protein
LFTDTETGFGYLERIQRLIEGDSEQPSRHSPTTDEILEGDRSWERLSQVLVSFVVKQIKFFLLIIIEGIWRK